MKLQFLNHYLMLCTGYYLDNKGLILGYVSGSIPRSFSLIRIIAVKVEVSLYVILQTQNV